MLPKTDDRSDMYYDNRCRQNPCVSFLSHKIKFIITKNTNSSRNKFGVRLGRVRFTQRAAKDRIELVGARAKPLPTAVEFRWFYRAGEIIAPLDRRSRRLRWSCTPRRRWWSAGLPSREQDRRPCRFQTADVVRNAETLRRIDGNGAPRFFHRRPGRSRKSSRQRQMLQRNEPVRR